MNAPNDLDESQRLESLRSHDILDTPAEERFDRITRLAARLFDVPVATLSLVDRDRLWFKSRQGLTICETAREGSFCGQAIQGRGPLVVIDTAIDARFVNNPLVTGEPLLRFYAGHPLADRDGRRLGALGIADRIPRILDASQLRDLGDLAKIAQEELSPQPAGLGPVEMVGGKSCAERREWIDPVTALWSREGITAVLRFGLVRARYERLPCAVIRAEVGTSIDMQNDRDQIRSEVAQVLRRGVRSHDAVGAFEDDQFLILLFACNRLAADARAQQLRLDVEDALALQGFPVAMTQGWAAFDPDDPLEAEVLIERSGAALERAQSAGPGQIHAA